MPQETHLILGVTRRGDDPKGPVTGLIYRETARLKWGALDELFPDAAPATARFFRLLPGRGIPATQVLERVERTVSGTPRFLFMQTDGKLSHESLSEKLMFSEAKKALLKPQVLSKPLALAPLCAEYLEISRLSDVMRKDMMNGERTLGDLTEVLGMSLTDQTLTDTLWELARQRWLTVHESGKAAENAICLNNPVPGLK